MAFTYCTGCGEKIDTYNAFCPNCGEPNAQNDYARKGVPHGNFEDISKNTETGNFEQRTTSFNPNQRPGNYGNFGGAPFNPFFGIAPRPQKKPISMGLLIFSILNIVLSFLMLPSLYFGIISLVYTIQAQSAKTNEETIRKKKIALVLNIAGAVLSVLTVISFGFMYAEVIAEVLSQV